MSPNGFDETNMEKQRQEEYYKSCYYLQTIKKRILSPQPDTKQQTEHSSTRRTKWTRTRQPRQPTQTTQTRERRIIYEDGIIKERMNAVVRFKSSPVNLSKNSTLWLKSSDGHFLELDCYNED